MNKKLKEIRFKKESIYKKIREEKKLLNTLEIRVRKIKRKIRSYETKIAELNQEEVKILNNNREITLFIGNPKGMI